MKKTLAILAFSVISSNAMANPRGGFDFGVWWANFKQSGVGQEMKTSISPALGTGIQLGWTFSWLFVEWSPSWLWVQKLNYSADDKSSDAYYLSIPALSVGIPLHFIRLEPYVGIEQGKLSFTSGTQAGYSGTAYKAGTAILLGQQANVGFRLKLEARRFSPGSDDAGVMPDYIKTTATTYFIGLSAAFAGK